MSVREEQRILEAEEEERLLAEEEEALVPLGEEGRWGEEGRGLWAVAVAPESPR